MRVKDYLESKKISYKCAIRTGKLNYILNCPFCEDTKQKFAINAESGLWNCFRLNHCGLKGDFTQLQEMLGDKPEKLDKLDIKIIKKNNNKKNKTILLKLNDFLLDYLHKRKITDEAIEYFNIKMGTSGEICFPYYKNNKIINIKHRTIDKSFWTEENSELYLYNIDNIKNKDFLIITEGEFDAVSLWIYGIENVSSVPNGSKNIQWIDKYKNKLDEFKKIYLCLDNDTAGQENIEIIINKLGKWKCKNVLLPYKDVNECLMNNVTSEEIIKCFEEAKEYSPKELKQAGNYLDSVTNIIRHPELYIGEETGLPALTKLIKGWRQNELTIWTGQNGSGKSTLLNQVCLFLAYRKRKSCIASLELNPNRFLRWATIQAIGKDNPNDKELTNFFQWINKYWNIIEEENSINPTKLFDVFEYAVKKNDINHFIIDSLMRIDLNENEKSNNEVRFIKDLTIFAKKYHVHIHLVAHPRKQQSDQDVPNKVDVKGRGEITDNADNVIVLWNNMIMDDLEEGSYNAILYLKKNREFGDLGQIYLKFIHDRRIFLCNGQQNIFY